MTAEIRVGDRVHARSCDKCAGLVVHIDTAAVLDVRVLAASGAVVEQGDRRVKIKWLPACKPQHAFAFRTWQRLSSLTKMVAS